METCYKSPPRGSSDVPNLNKHFYSQHMEATSSMSALSNLWLTVGLIAVWWAYVRLFSTIIMGSPLSKSTDLHNLGNLYHDQGEMLEAEKMYIRPLAQREKARGAGHTSTLDTANSLGIIYCKEGKLDEAEQMYLRAPSEREKALGADHLCTLETVGNLGILYCYQGKLDKSEDVFKELLARREEKLGADHISAIDTLHNLGNVYYTQGRLDEAQ